MVANSYHVFLSCLQSKYMAKKIFIGLVVVLLIIQLIRPEKNISEIPSPNDIRVHHAVPNNVLSILKRSCFDCHSNNTHYPWYAEIQPVGWWLADHIEEGKEELDFSEFGSYSAKKADHKLEEVVEMIEEKEMPLESYTRIHKDAILSKDDAELVINWANKLRATIKP